MRLMNGIIIVIKKDSRFLKTHEPLMENICFHQYQFLFYHRKRQIFIYLFCFLNKHIADRVRCIQSLCKV